MLPEIGIHISSKNTDIGQSSTVYKRTFINILFLIRYFNFCLPILNSFSNKLDLGKSLKHFGIAKLNTAEVYVNISFDSSTARQIHITPVFKRLIDQRVSWNSSNCIVKILHFNSSECDFNHITVCSVFGHLYPVFWSYHFICN